MVVLLEVVVELGLALLVVWTLCHRFRDCGDMVLVDEVIYCVVPDRERKREILFV